MRCKQCYVIVKFIHRILLGLFNYYLFVICCCFFSFSPFFICFWLQLVLGEQKSSHCIRYQICVALFADKQSVHALQR